MKKDILHNHIFQFISFFYVYHPYRINSKDIQINNDSHILHITKGQGKIIIDNEAYEICSGCVVSIPHFSPFSMQTSDDFEMFNIHYKLFDKNQTNFENKFRLKTVFKPNYFDWCRKKIIELRGIYEDNNNTSFPDPVAHQIILKHFSQNDLIEISRSVSDQRIQKVINYLDNPDINDFDSAKLAKLCSLSKSQMNRNFSKILGISPLKYWEKRRIKDVCLALKNYPGSISEVAENFGFCEQGYFTHWFKKMTSVTPAEYRRKLNKKGFSY